MVDNDIQEFWDNLENEIGEEIIEKSLAKYTSGPEGPGPYWGLCFVTRTSLFFRYEHQESWLFSMVKRNSVKKSPSKDFLIKIPLTSITEFKKASSRWVFFFWREAPGHRIYYGDNDLLILRFETRNREMLNALEDLLEKGF